MVSSATAMAFWPGQLATNTPRALAAARSIVFTPAPARTIKLSAVPASIAFWFTSLERTTRMFTPATACGSSATVSCGR